MFRELIIKLFVLQRISIYYYATYIVINCRMTPH